MKLKFYLSIMYCKPDNVTHPNIKCPLENKRWNKYIHKYINTVSSSPKQTQPVIKASKNDRINYFHIKNLCFSDKKVTTKDEQVKGFEINISGNMYSPFKVKILHTISFNRYSTSIASVCGAIGLHAPVSVESKQQTESCGANRYRTAQVITLQSPLTWH